MGIYKSLSEDLVEFDVIIAGGGTAACVIAGRLAEADPSLSILMIEGGQDNYQNPTVVIPAMMLSHLKPDSKTAIAYKAIKSNQLAGREVTVPSGGILGGGSSINFMMYTRAQREDYDSWNTPGWSTEELLPFLRKLETYHGPRDDILHGYSGPVQVSDGTLRVKKVEEDFLAAAAAAGWSEAADLQTLDHNNAFGRWKRYISPEGKRCDTAHMYLHPRLRDGAHENLHVLVESQVVRVLFDGDKRACGVEYRANPLFQESASASASTRVVRAKKLVIVSCGACGTPSVLERSGLGRPDILEKAGVPIVEDLPGVGHDYQDHHLILYPFRTSLEPHETQDELFQGRLSWEEAIEKGDPRLGWNTLDVAGKLRPKECEVAALGPEFKAAWDRDFRDYPNRPLMLMALLNGFFGDPTTVEPGQYVTVAPYTAYPYSRGHLHITGPSIDDALNFNVGFFNDAGDVDIKKQMWGYKAGREVIRRSTFYRGEVSLGHPPFPPNSKAACVQLDAQLTANEIKDIEYTPEDDKILEKFLRENIATTWHSLGTAKMAPREEMGVVDKDLNVYGVKGLKVADLSIAPLNVAANTNNTAIVVGEKAADVVIGELGLGFRG